MRSILFRINIICFILLIVIHSSCKKKTPTPSPTNNDFDKSGMLKNVGQTIIIPAFQVLNNSCYSLDSVIMDFNLSPDDTKLIHLQTIFKNTYRAWQSASAFKFGPAEQEYLNENLNTFPTNASKINSNISSGSYNLDAITNLDAKGFPGIDYLLFGLGANNTEILTMYTLDNDAMRRKQYLSDLASAIKTHTENVLNHWLSGGGSYINSFTTALGTDVGSSLGQVVNQLDYDLEVLKNYKLGIPLGKQSMGALFPEKVEAYYSQFSVELSLIQLKSLQNIYLGKSSQGDGLGLDDYLISLKAQYNGGSLNDAIKNQFSVAIDKLEAVPDPLSDAVASNSTSVNAAYIEIQKLVVLLKTDMPSSLGVLITYEDTDGD